MARPHNLGTVLLALVVSQVVSVQVDHKHVASKVECADDDARVKERHAAPLTWKNMPSTGPSIEDHQHGILGELSTVQEEDLQKLREIEADLRSRARSGENVTKDVMQLIEIGKACSQGLSLEQAMAKVQPAQALSPEANQPPPQDQKLPLDIIRRLNEARARMRTLQDIDQFTFGEEISVLQAEVDAIESKMPSSTLVEACPGEINRNKDQKCLHDTHRVCLQMIQGRSKLPIVYGGNGGADFWNVTGNPERREGQLQQIMVGGDSWCVQMWQVANLINRFGCDSVRLRCEATDIRFVLAYPEEYNMSYSATHQCLQQKCHHAIHEKLGKAAGYVREAQAAFDATLAEAKAVIADVPEDPQAVPEGAFIQQEESAASSYSLVAVITSAVAAGAALLI